jgi:nucleoside-diphosphate-sugar epimerase
MISLPGPRVLVTGAGGFLGPEIVRQALECGCYVRALAHSRPVPAAAHERFAADLADERALREAVDGVDVVIHAAGLAHVFGQRGYRTNSFRDVNVIGSLNLARAAAAARTPHFVLVSSVSVYGPGATVRNEQVACAPDTPYGLSKLEAEHRIRELAREADMRLTILRLATIYGEGDPGNVSRLMRAIDRRRFVWVGDGQNRKSLIYRSDAGRACVVAAVARNGPDAIFNVTAAPVLLADVVSTIADALGTHVPSVRIPRGIGRAGANVARRLAPYSRNLARAAHAVDKWLSDDDYDGREFEAVMKFRTAVSLTEGIRRQADWYRRPERRR